MSYLFADFEEFNQPLNTWDTSQVTDMELMFHAASSFKQPLDTWDVASVTSFDSMFAGLDPCYVSTIPWLPDKPVCTVLPPSSPSP